MPIRLSVSRRIFDRRYGLSGWLVVVSRQNCQSGLAVIRCFDRRNASQVYSFHCHFFWGTVTSSDHYLHLLMKEVDCLMSSYLFNVFGITYVLCFASFRLLRLLRSLRVVSQFVLFACEGEGLINCIIGALRNSFVCSVVSTFACFRSSVTISMKKDHGYDLTFINLLRYRLLPLGLIQCQSGSSDLS